MTRRAALAIACAVLLVGGNTALMLHLRSGRPAGDRFPSGRPPADPPPEHPVRPRPFAAGEPLLPREEARALRVLVADPAGAPVPGAVVRVRAHRRVRRGPFPDPVLAEGRTGGDGAASFPALPARARYLAEAEAPGRAPGSADGPGPELAVLLHGAGVLSGRVLEEGTDAPVEGAEVELLPAADTDPPEAPNRRLHPPAEARCATGSDGTFRFEGLPPGTWRVRVRPLLHGPPGEDAAATLGEGGEAVLDVRVRRGVDVAGRVLFAGSDRPLAGGILRVAASSGFGRPPSWVREVPLDGEGRFLLPSLPAWTAAPAAFATSPAGAVASAPFPRPVIDPATGRQAGEVVVHIPWNNPAGLAYAGRVTDARGAPVAGARVLVGEGLPVLVGMRDRGGVAGGGGEAWTGVDGKWSLAAQGHLGGEVLVLHPDFAPGYFLLPYRSRNRTFDFTLADPAALLVLARDAAGRGVAGAEVRALLRHPEETLGRLTFGDVLEGLRANPVTDRDGRALVGPLGPGSWYLAARS
ncbi:MAG: carboxypeptidase-like regulatory domain-containing protein, partial [Planctomycetes bacterium]|nr:carboxypeptidase-like regulatory domain-containing protein [Planctomycetota bacterium]